MVVDEIIPQECPVNAAVPRASIVSPFLFLLHSNDFPDDIICDIVIYVDSGLVLLNTSDIKIQEFFHRKTYLKLLGSFFPI